MAPHQRDTLMRAPIKAMARLCEISYEPIGDWSKSVASIGQIEGDQWELTNAYCMPASGMEMMRCVSDAGVIYAIRGTKEPRDWATNLDADLSSTSDMHKGFERGAQSLLEVVRAQPMFDSVWVTGHSMGGAVAAILAAMIVKDGRKMEPHVFGSPRPGGPRLAELLNKNFPDGTSWSNNNDIVPRVPPASWGYSHWGQWHYIASDWDVVVNPASALVLGDRIFGRVEAIQHLKWVDGFSDHKMEYYLKAVNQFTDEQRDRYK